MEMDERLSELERGATNESLDPQCWEIYAALVDDACDARDEANLLRLIAIGASIETAVSGWPICWVRFCVANAWSALYGIRRYPQQALDWHQPELTHQIYALRSALQHDMCAELPLPRRAQLRINLANAFNSVGRIIDALDQWRAALEDRPGIAMAFGCMGDGLRYYGTNLYDAGHAIWLLDDARRRLTAAVMIGAGRDEATYPEAVAHFQKVLTDVQDLLQRNGHAEALDHGWQDEYTLGASEAECSYRRWCLDRRLFLNPMNDAFTAPIAAHDPMGLPDHLASGSGITYLAFFNQMKQEFAYARWCLYEGTATESVHWADREVMLTMNCDSARYGMALEQVKTSFRAAYSLLDKVAYFISHYWHLGIPEKSVDFASIWIQAKKPNVGKLWPQLESSQNLWLQALYQLSLDIHSKDHQAIAAPDARDIKLLRNHLEHKFSKVVDLKSGPATPDILKDHLANETTPDEMRSKALRMLRTSRSALIYLSLAVHRSETLRESDEPMLALDVAPLADEHKIG